LIPFPLSQTRRQASVPSSSQTPKKKKVFDSKREHVYYKQ